jgi:hypothetical protein
MPGTSVDLLVVVAFDVEDAFDVEVAFDVVDEWCLWWWCLCE